METDKIIVTLAGIILGIFTYWFFLMKKEKKEVKAQGEIEIVVRGGYSPEIISLERGKKTTIYFLRKDPSSCLEEVVLSDFKIRKFLPMNERIAIELTPQKTGEYPFSCGMNMFHGKIIVK